MNIYNKLFILEYSKSPYFITSTTKIYIQPRGHIHRDFDFPVIVCMNGNKAWYAYNRPHRLIGPAIIYLDQGYKEYSINGSCIKKINL